MAAGSLESRWPPQSPHEALLSSPSGRNKVRQIYNRTSPSPSPIARATSARGLQVQRKILGSGVVERDNDEEEDEETLQLKLQAIEAKLRLKRLQQKQSRPKVTSPSNRDFDVREDFRKENIPPPSQRHPQSQQRQDIQIPASPHNRATTVPDARSPGRFLLGIDKGLTGRNVSLRRPVKSRNDTEDPFLSCLKSGNIRKESSTDGGIQSRPPRPGKSFGERIAESRDQDNTRLERESYRHLQRSIGFGVDQTEINASKLTIEEDNERRKQQAGETDAMNRDGFSRDQILHALRKSDSGVVKRSKSSKAMLSSQKETSTEVWMNPNAESELCHSKKPECEKSKGRSKSLSPMPKSTEDRNENRRATKSSDHLFEPFSTIHLSKRLLTQDLLTRTFAGKSVLRVVDLLANVKSPDYLLPDNLDADYVVIGMIATKSSPLTHKDASKPTAGEATTAFTEATTSSQNTRGKFMIMQLTDLKWSVDLYLFTTAYTRFYKLTPGTVIAILNPSIMPPPPGKTDTGRFSLTLNSSEDTVLEIGTARDLGWCKATRKDGKQCSDWVDKRHTEFCEFHVDRVIERSRRGRMEVNGMSAPFAPGGRKQGRTGYFGSGKAGTGPKSRSGNFPDRSESREDGFRKEGQRYDRTTSSKYFVAPPIPGRSAAQLLDREDMMTSRGESKEERLRKRLAEREKENEIAKRLGDRGNGAGSQYLRSRQDNANGHDIATGGSGLDQVDAEVDASSLGLLSNRAKEVHLSPIRKLGLKRKGLWHTESTRKKTRLLTEKGLREPGRESLGGAAGNGHDDDDGLEIE